MNYELSDAHRGLQAEMGKFCREEIAPGAALFDEAPPEEAAARMRANLKKLAGKGFLHLLLGGDLLGSCVAGEELARACPVDLSGGHLLGDRFREGREAFRYGYPAGAVSPAPRRGRGDRRVRLHGGGGGIGPRRDAKPTRSSKDGCWILNGEKDLVTNAPLADFFLVLAWTDREAGPEQGLSLFLVDREAEGVTIGKPLETMGLRGAPIAGIRLENCRVTDEALLGGTVGAGWGQIQALLEEIKLAVSVLCVGVGMACMEASTGHAKAKKAFGKPIGLFEGVGAKLATMFTFNDIGRMMTCRAAWAMEQNDPEGPVLASCAKLFTSEAAGRIADLAMQVHGGHGYLKGAVVERLYRDARFAELAYGTSEMQRAFIAKDSLDRFRAA